MNAARTRKPTINPTISEPFKEPPHLMPIDEDDYQLSMKVSRRAHEDPPGLRSLLLHRFTITMKGIARRPLRAPRNDPSLFCEECGRWFRLGAFPEVTQCPGCGNVYRMELAVYEQVEDLDDE